MTTLRQVDSAKTARALWIALDALFLTKTLPNKIYLLEKLFSFKMDPGKDVEGNLSDFSIIVKSLAHNDKTFDDEDLAVILLNSLPESYREIKNAIKYGRDTLAQAIVSDALKSRELELKRDNRIHSREESLFVRERSEKKEFNFHNKKGRGKSKMRSKSKDKSGKKCYHCGKLGHFKKDCFDWKRKQKDPNNSDVDNAAIATEFNSLHVMNVSEEEFDKNWILDTGCTFHMCPDRSWFYNYRETEPRKVYMGDNNSQNVIGVGDIAIRIYDGAVTQLRNVRYVPNLKKNLISLGSLEDEGYTFKSGNKILKIMKGSLIVMKGPKRNGLYYLEGRTEIPFDSSLLAVSKDKTELWHNRMGHIGFKGLKSLSNQKLLGKDDIETMEFCETCVLGKSHKVSFEASSHRTSRPLDYVHADLWGPEKHSTFGGSKYFLSLVDDYSRKVWIYPLKAKSETFGKFRIWLKSVENQLDKKLKTLRTDNGLEFCNSEFDNFCK